MWLPKYVYTLDRSNEYFVARKRGKGNLPSHFHDKTEHFYIVDSYISVNNNIRGA